MMPLLSSRSKIDIGSSIEFVITLPEQVSQSVA